jgi:multimeric flavodoxin WrbA
VNALIVNMSPRSKGTSAMLAGMCAAHLEQGGTLVERLDLYPALQDPCALYRAVGRADVLVLSGPCYINTYPAEVTALLQGMAAHPEALHGQQLYGMIQGGMPTAHTHESGLNQLELFARKCGLRYMGGFVMGMGAMLDGAPLDRLINAKSVKTHLNAFFDHIQRGEPSPRQLYQDAQLKLPSIGWRLLALVANRAINAQLKALDAKNVASR